MKASGKIGSSGVLVSDNVEQRFETDIHTHLLQFGILFCRHSKDSTGFNWLKTATTAGLL